jgi:Ca2+-binding EF-hand superfamily protein
MFYTERSHSEIAAKLREFDKDGSGNLDLNEIVLAMKKFRGNLSEAQVLKLVEKVDKNNDKVININGSYVFIFNCSLIFLHTMEF